MSNCRGMAGPVSRAGLHDCKSGSQTLPRPFSPVRQPLTVGGWLETLGLIEYNKLFSAFGSVQDLLTLTESDIRDLGVKNGAHRARLVSSLVMIRETQQRYTRSPKQTCAGVSAGRCATPPLSNSPYHSATLPHTSVYQSSTVADNGHHTLNISSSVLTDMVSNSWYHGTISRVSAEDLVRRDGEFLVRDSTTQPGDFVLTLRWGGIPLHFVINRRCADPLEQAMGLRYLFHFEEDAFSSVTELIQSYVRQGKPVTVASGAVARIAVPRTAANSAQHAVSSPSLLSKCGSQPLLSGLSDHSGCSRSNSLERQMSMPSVAKLATVEIPIDDRQPRMRSHQRVGSEPMLSPAPLSTMSGNGFFNECYSELNPTESTLGQSTLSGSDSDLSRPPPPKPSRLPTIKIRRSQGEKRPVVAIRNVALYEDDGKDYSDFDQVTRWTEKQSSQEVSSDTSSGVAAELASYDVPCSVKSVNAVSELLTRSVYDNVAEHDSRFLTPDNRPLESSAISVMKSLILDTSPQLLARHITLLDIELLRIANGSNLGFGIKSGLELITLPQGNYLRQDVIERFHCLRLFVSAIILKCTSKQELVRMIHQWIQTASELRSTAIGNLFAFSAIMHALLSAPISRLNTAWLQLRQLFNGSSIIFETKLCTLQHSIDNASGALPLQGVTVPHILPLSEMLETSADENGDLIMDYGIDTVLAHLDMARVITSECRLYHSASVALQSSCGLTDQALFDLLCTPTHMRLLWGTRGVGVQRSERLAKFEQVLHAFSEKVEPRESSL